MPIYKVSSESISPVEKTTFSAVNLHERRDLQRILREKIEVISPGTLVIAEEYAEWDESRRRIDLLGIDRDANLVVIELKRTEDGGHMDLQAIRYAAMVSTMTFDQAVDGFSRYLEGNLQHDTDARTELLNFLGWDEPRHDQFAQEVKIVLASAEFSRELTTAVLWLNQRDLDIRCVRLQPYNLSGTVLVDVQQVIPPPEAADYQVRVRERDRMERAARTSGTDRTKYDLMLEQQKFRGLSKRKAIFEVVKYLMHRGVARDALAEHLGRPADRVLIAVEGREIDENRFFCRDNELLRWEGRTYALSNQWGGQDWEKAMSELKKAFPEHPIEFEPSN